MSSSSYALTSKKLKIWHVNGNVTVFQDGSDADVDATTKYDDFFEEGTNRASREPESAKLGVELVRMSFRAGEAALLTLRVHDHVTDNFFGIDLQDIVEFYCDVGATFTPSITTFPSWHLHEQTGQQKVFRGRVMEKSAVSQSTGGDVFELVCKDPRAWADDVRLQRDIDAGVILPHLIFNPDSDERAWYASVKKTSNPTWPTHPSFTTGWPSGYGGPLTMRDALAYLNDFYADELTAAGVKVVGVDIFDDDDLEPLTMQLPRLDFVQVGFFEAVKRILELAPDYILTVDPKTTQWRIVKARRILIPGEETTVTGWTDNTTTIDVTVADASAFSDTPYDPGNLILLVSATDSRFSSYAQVLTKAGSVLTISPPGPTYATGTKVFPLEGASDQLPVVGVDLKSGALNVNLKEHLDGAYSAVRIVSTKQEKSERTVVRSLGPSLLNIVPAWDSGFEAVWKPDHADREQDLGRDGIGIPIYQHLVVGGKSKIYYLAGLSQYGLDQHIVSGVGEWQDCAFQLIWQGGTDVSTQQPRYASRITAMVYSADIDGSGNPGYILTLNHDLTTHPDGPGTVNTSSSPGGGGVIDRFRITHDLNLTDLDGARASKRLNALYEVNRKWAHSSTSEEVIRGEADACMGQAQVSGIAGVNAPANQVIDVAATQVPMTYQELVDYWTPRLGSGNFAPRAFFLDKPVQNLEYTDCAQTNPPEPPRLEIKYTTESVSVRNARAPDTGFSGLAYALHGLQREYVIQTDRFKYDDQQGIYDDLALAVLRDVSEPAYIGEVEMDGIAPWLNLADLGVRIQMTNIDWTYYTSNVNYLNKFRAPLSEVTFNFESQSTSLSFSRRDVIERLSGRDLEQLYVKEPEQDKQIKEALAAAEKAAACAARPRQATITTVPSCRIQYPAPAGGPSRGGGKPPPGQEPKQEGQGTNESSIGLPVTVGSAGKSYENKGPQASGFIERDYLSQVWFWSGMAGKPGLESGGSFTEDPTAVRRYTGLPLFNAKRVMEVAKATMGFDLAYRGAQVHAKIEAGSTTTVLEIAYPGLTTNEFQGGTVEIIGEEDIARPIYDVASNDADSVTLSSAMSEAAPAAGAVAVLRGPGLPVLDGTDFPDGGTAFQDPSSEWFVIIPDGIVVSATLSDGTLTEKTTSPNTPVMHLGLFGGNVVPRGAWDFLSTAGVTGLMGAGGGERATAEGIFSGVIGVGSYQAVLGNGGGSVAAIEVPSDYRCDILRIEGSATSGATAGDYLIEFGVDEDSTFMPLAGETVTQNERAIGFDQWDADETLLSLTGPASWRPAIRNNASSEDETADTEHRVSITYRFVAV